MTSSTNVSNLRLQTLNRMRHVFRTDQVEAVDSAVRACIDRQDLSDMVYAEVYWHLFVKHIDPFVVAGYFRDRVNYLGAKR